MVSKNKNNNEDEYTVKDEFKSSGEKVSNTVERTSVMNNSDGETVKTTETEQSMITPEGSTVTDTLIQTQEDTSDTPWYKNATIMFLVGVVITGLLFGGVLIFEKNKDHKEFVSEATTAASLSEQLSGERENVQVLAKKYDELQKQNSEIELQLKEKINEVEQANKEIESLNTESESMKKAIETNDKELKETQESLKDTTNKLNEANKKIDELTKELNSKSTETTTNE